MEFIFIILVGFIFLEIFLDILLGKKYYRLNVLIADVSTGVLFALVGVFILSAALFVHSKIVDNISLASAGIQLFPFENPFGLKDGTPGFSVDPGLLASWGVAILLVDFIYYWFHRLAHEVNFLWACHVTHHSSEELNFSVSFRGNVFQRIFEYMFFLPLAFLGMPALVFLLSHRILKIYQFLVHTRFVGKLGFLEYFMVTPSNHRVHHGTEKKYIDKNHGGILIVWDKLFGSYQEEEEEPLYGLTVPLNSFNPVWSNLHVFKKLFGDLKNARNWKDRMILVFGKPDDRPEYLALNDVKASVPAYSEKYDPYVTGKLLWYTAVHGFISILLGSALWKAAKTGYLPLPLMLAVSFFMLYSLINVNGVLERKSWIPYYEKIRLAVMVLIGLIFYNTGFISRPFVVSVIGVAAVSFFYFFRAWNESPDGLPGSKAAA